MPRPRKPDELHILEGTWRPDRNGDPETAVVAEGEPTATAKLTGDALKLWRAVVPELARTKVAHARDSAALTAMCQWWGRYCKLSRRLDRMPATSTKLVSAMTGVAIAFDKFNIVASRFGLNPSDRAKLRVSTVENGKPGVMSRKRQA